MLEKVILYIRSLIPKRVYFELFHFYLNLRSMLYIGGNFICPCCNGHFRKFLSYGMNHRSNVQCPRCGSVERHRLMWLYLKNKTKFFSDNLRVLYFAPKFFFQKKFENMPNLDLISADIDSPIATVKMDITDILYKENSFNVIICNHVLEHIVDDQKAMKELFRVLKPGGWAIIQCPIDYRREITYEDKSITIPKDRERFFGQKDHVRRYGRDFKERLKKAGFILKVDDYIRSLRDDKIRKYRLKQNEKIYFCIKPEE